MQINDGQNDDEDTSYDPEANKEQLMTEFNSMPCYYAAHDNADEKQEFFDKIYVAFWKRNCNGVYNYTDEDYNDFARCRSLLGTAWKSTSIGRSIRITTLPCV
ncbi:MAG: hypothetical protein IJ756_05540 [Paludibacteraceae bacterium]|nr:hypothetical protein [Paludibacteraceae bacterium]